MFQDCQYPRFLNFQSYEGFTYFHKHNSEYAYASSEYASGCNYGIVLSIQGLRICQISAYASVLQGSEYL